MSGLYTFLFILFAIIAILVGLIVHELGHFVFARLFKVNVKEFSIGIGPKLFSKKYKGTTYAFRPLPVMAYVMIDSRKLINLYTEIVEEQKAEIQKFLLENKALIDAKDKKALAKLTRLNNGLKKYEEMASNPPGNLLVDDIPIWQQILIYLGGVFSNILFFAIFYLITYFGLAAVIAAVESQYKVVIERNPFVQLGNIFVNLGKNMVFYNAWKPAGDLPSSGTIIGDGITFNQSRPTAEYLTFTIFNYFSMFNLVLFIFNIIPFPPLDGFKVLTASLSKNKVIKINKKTENILTYTGVGLLGYIFLSGILADVIR